MEKVTKYLALIFFVSQVLAVSIHYPESEPIIKLDLSARFYLSYQNETIDFNLEEVSDITGTENDTDSVHWLQFKSGGDNITFTFYFIDDDIHLNVTYDMDPHSHWSDVQIKSVVGETQIDLGLKKDKNLSYLCLMPANYTFTTNHSESDMTMELSMVQLQAFGLKNGQYGKSVECGNDRKAEQGNYTLENGKNETCVSLTTRIDADIFYEATIDKKVTTKATHVMFPQGSVVPGGCTKTGSILMTIAFYQGLFNVSFNFTKIKGTNYHVYVSDIILTYEIGPPFFPSVTPKYLGTKQTLHLNKTSKLFEITEGSYYKCMSNTTYHLGGKKETEKADVYISDFKYVAFSHGPLGGKNYQQCSDDVKVSNIVPIAVGAALGVLVVIVLIAYIIGRRRSRGDYEAM